jgi:pimeloyl-ACP methyl ester carboxylesterase
MCPCKTKPSIVFVHGIWADGLSFSKVIPTLQAEGHEVIATQYGLDTLAGDVAAVKRTPGRVSGPAIRVGHSYGGTVITAAGTDDRVAGLVYVAALAPDSVEASQSQQEQFGTTDMSPTSKSQTGGVWMLPQGVACFAGDLSDEEQTLVWATHFAPAADPFKQKLDGSAWRAKPSWYIEANKDRTVQPELQRFVAKRMGATIYEVDSSHVPMLSQPSSVIDVIRTAANAVSSGPTRTACRQAIWTVVRDGPDGRRYSSGARRT